MMGIVGTDPTTISPKVHEELALKVCEVWKPWYWSKDDTPGSVLQAKQNNAARKGWGCSNP